MPVREHVRRFAAPSQALTDSLRRHFRTILELYEKHNGVPLEGLMNQITLNLGNLQHLLSVGLHRGNPTLADTIQCIISLNSFFRVTGRGHTTLMELVPPALLQLCGHRLEVLFTVELLACRGSNFPMDLEPFVIRSISLLDHLDDLTLASRFYEGSGHRYFVYTGNKTTGGQFLDKALALARECGDIHRYCNALIISSEMEWRAGHYHAAQKLVDEAQHLGRLSGDLYIEARTLEMGATTALYLGNYRRCSLLCERTKDVRKMCGMLGSLLDGNVSQVEAETHLLKSEYAEARAVHMTIVESSSPDQSAAAYAYAWLSVAEIDVIVGAPSAEVYHHLEKAKACGIERLGGVDIWKRVFADLALREGDTATAESMFREDVASNWGRDNQALSYCLERLADTTRWTETTSDSPVIWPVVYLVYAHTSTEKLAVHKALLFLAQIFILAEEDTAHSLLVVALEGFTFMDVHRSKAQCLLHLGDLEHKRGNTTKAIELWEAARPLFAQSLQSTGVAQVDSKLVKLQSPAHLQRHNTSGEVTLLYS
ncbi:hypothetical protein B0H16DRAFT_1805672 [Mycena metata]|uniref:Uncharacterized protein n=1 Tax=Mycena metata TaxID=1033252 RepID=A0AAD7JED2_9AGAR|nr:hypothetical protein B0H16DRAFT_1805672 [Mycena metata]